MTEIAKRFDTVVVGLGKTGASVVDYFLSRGESVAVTDSRNQPPEFDRIQQDYPDLSLFLGSFNQDVLLAARKIVISPGVALSEPAIQAAIAAGVEITSDVEIFCQQVKAPIVAVTGSNGKSTVVTLVKEMIEQNGLSVELAGNIGRPVLELLKHQEPDFYVLELSSFQLDTLNSLNATAALVLNISPDHMDRYAGLAEYARSKQGIYKGAGSMVINRDEPLVAAMAEAGRKSVFYRMSEPEATEFGIRVIKDRKWLCHGKKSLLAEDALKIRGAHNISNALASLALGSVIGLTEQNMIEALKKFPGLAHRCQWIANIGGVDWYNDSKGTNVGASCAAIESLGIKQGLILIAGGDGKQADFSKLARAIEKHVRAVILIGKDAGKIDQALAKDSERYFSTTMQGAVSLAAKLAGKGEAVLLSPACASQDMFRDYQHRGEVFVQAAQALQGAQQ